MTRPTLIVGKIARAENGSQVLEPLGNIDPHGQEVLAHQQKVAALIAAAYLYRDRPSAKNLAMLTEAARAL